MRLTLVFALSILFHSTVQANYEPVNTLDQLSAPINLSREFILAEGDGLISPYQDEFFWLASHDAWGCLRILIDCALDPAQMLEARDYGLDHNIFWWIDSIQIDGQYYTEIWLPLNNGEPGGAQWILEHLRRLSFIYQIRARFFTP